MLIRRIRKHCKAKQICPLKSFPSWGVLTSPQDSESSEKKSPVFLKRARVWKSMGDVVEPAPGAVQCPGCWVQQERLLYCIDPRKRNGSGSFHHAADGQTSPLELVGKARCDTCIFHWLDFTFAGKKWVLRSFLTLKFLRRPDFILPCSFFMLKGAEIWSGCNLLQF